MLMGQQMGRGSRNRRHGKEGIKAKRSEPAGQRAAERQQPQAVEADVAEVGVQQRIGEKGPDLRTDAVVDRVREQRRALARRNEGEAEQHLLVDRLRQHHPDEMDAEHHGQQRGQRARQREYRFV